MNPQELQLFHHPSDRLRLSIGDRSWPTVKPVWTAPLTFPRQYLALLDGKGHEIAMVKNPDDLQPEAKAAVMTEIGRRYLSSKIESIVHAKGEFGATYWTVQTERGIKDFVTQSLQENVQWLSERHVLLIDVDGNRFEIDDVALLDARSQAYIHQFL